MIAPWITVDVLQDPTSPFAEEAVASASFVLYLLSGRKFSGVATTTETYCQMGMREAGLRFPYSSTLLGANGSNGFQIWPELRNGELYNQIGGPCSTCGCPHLIRLRGGPVLSVQSVYDGEQEVTLSDVAIFDYSCITAPNRCWRTCGEVEVTYTYGAPPPAMGQAAARALADQFVLAVTGDDACALPQRVTQVSRQGVSWTLLDPQDFLDKGLTGIYSVDLFLRAVNPDKAKMRSRVFSPDIPRAKSHRWAAPVTPAPGPMMMPAAPPVAPAPVNTAPAAVRMVLSSPTTTAATSTVQTASPVGMTLYEGRPLRWVVPGAFRPESPPVVTVQPSGKEVPPDTLLWRTGNFTLDLTAEQVDQLLPPGSVLVVSPQLGDSSASGTTSYPVERRSL